MSEERTKSKEMLAIRFDMESEDGISRSMYNLSIGLTVAFGCIINALVARLLTGQLLRLNPIVLLIVYFAGTIASQIVINKTEKPAVAFLGFIGLALAMSLTLTFIVAYYSDATVERAMWITAAITAAMTLASTLLPRVFLSMGKVLGMTLLLVIIANVVVLLFFRNLAAVFDYVFIAIFAGYIGFDWARAQNRPATIVNAIRSAAAIYVDVLNIFIRILAIIGRKRD